MHLCAPTKISHLMIVKRHTHLGVPRGAAIDEDNRLARKHVSGDKLLNFY